MQYAILAACRRPGFDFCAGWYRRTFRGKDAPAGFSESGKLARAFYCNESKKPSFHSLRHSRK